MSVVGVVVIDWTEIGASPPTGTFPTMICLVLRRGVSTGGVFGSPRLIAGTLDNYFLSSIGDTSLNAKPNFKAKRLELERIYDISNYQDNAEQQQQPRDEEGQRHHLAGIDRLLKLLSA